MLVASIPKAFGILFTTALAICLAAGSVYLTKTDFDGWELAMGVVVMVSASVAISIGFGFSPWLLRIGMGCLARVSEWAARYVIRRRLSALRTPIAVRGISNDNGTVAFSFLPDSPDMISTGMYLDVVVENSKERWGTVQVVSDQPNNYRAIAFDRTNKEFFSSLEDRMNIDPSPPKGMELVPTVPQEIEEFIIRILRGGDRSS